MVEKMNKLPEEEGPPGPEPLLLLLHLKMILGFTFTTPEARGITETTTLELHEKWLQDIHDGGDDANNPPII